MKYLISKEGTVRQKCTLCQRPCEVPSLSTIKIYVGDTIFKADSRKRSTMDTKSVSRSKVGAVGHKIVPSQKKVTVEDCCTRCRDLLGVS